MTREEILRLALKLPARDRADLAVALWDSVATDPDAFPLTDAQKAKLDRRLATLETDPTNTLSWNEVRKSIRP